MFPRGKTFIIVIETLWIGLLGVTFPAFLEAGPEKFTPELAGQLQGVKPEEPVRVIVRLAERTDVAAVAGRPRSVELALQQTAKRSQAGLLAALAGEQQRGTVTEVRPLWIINGVILTATREVIMELADRPEVDQIRHNGKVEIPRPRESPTQRPAAAGSEWGIDRIGAPGVWALGFDGTGTVVGSIDTGVDPTHPDLAGKMRPNDNWYDPYGLTSGPEDTDGHGTHTIGTMVGGDADGTNIGVAPGAQFIAALGLPYGSGSDAGLLLCMQWMMDPDGNPNTDDAPDVVNNSWGGPGGGDPWAQEVVQNWVAAGIFPTFANGNAGPGFGTVGNPAEYPESFGVGATDVNDQIADFSSRGPTWDGRVKPDVSAPGVAVKSSVPGGGYGIWDGTSMAAPHVSGSVSLLRQKDPSLTVAQLRDLLEASAVDLGAFGKDNDYGVGRIDVLAAASLSGGTGTIEGQVTRADTGEPLAATVRIVELNRNVPTDPQTGAYRSLVPASTSPYHLEASAFGFLPEAKEALVGEGATVVANFALSPDPNVSLAHVALSHSWIGDLTVVVGVGDPDNPDWGTVIYPTGQPQGEVEKPGGARILSNYVWDVDLTNAAAYLPPEASHVWFLSVTDNAGADEGEVTEFWIQHQGARQDSNDVPAPIRDFQTTRAYIPSPEGTVLVAFPNGGEILGAKTHTILWATSGSPAITLEYSADAGQTWNPLMTGEANDGACDWDTSGLPDGTDYLIRVTREDTGQSDTSDNVFEVRSNLRLAVDVSPWTWGLQPTRTVGEGQNFSVDLFIQEVTDLELYEITLAFDAAVLGATSATVGGFMSQDGGTPLFMSDLSVSGQVTLSCAMVGNDPAQMPDGSGVVAKVNFTVVGRENDTSPLRIPAVRMRRANGAAIAPATDDGSVNVETLGDFDQDGDRDSVDWQAFRAHWGTTPGDSPWEDRYDVVEDGAVNIADFWAAIGEPDGWLPGDGTGALAGARAIANLYAPDDYVDVEDLQQFADSWHSRTGDPNWNEIWDFAEAGGPPPPPPFSLYSYVPRDGYVDIEDLDVFADNWHQGRGPIGSLGHRSRALRGPTDRAGAVLLDVHPDGPADTAENARLLPVGTSFEVALLVADVQNLDTFDLYLQYDPTVLRVAEKGVQEGPFLRSQNGTTFFLTDLREPGWLQMSGSLAGTDPQQAPDGRGVLATVRFVTTGEGSSPLRLTGVTWADSSGRVFAPEAPSGGVIVHPTWEAGLQLLALPFTPPEAQAMSQKLPLRLGWDAAVQSYVPAAEGLEASGRNVWWIAPTGRLALDLTGQLVPQDQPCTLPLTAATGALASGCNLICNPFVYAVPKEALHVRREGQTVAWTEAVARGWVRDAISAWDARTGLYEDVGGGNSLELPPTLQPLRGYWVKAYADCELIIEPITARTSEAETPVLLSPTPDHWRLPVIARAGPSRSAVCLGVTRGAQTGADAWDVDNPPLPSLGREVVVSFPHAEWGRRAGRYNLEVQPPVTGRSVWMLEVRAGPGQEPVTLTWPQLSRLPEETWPVLIDLDSQTSIPLRTRSNYTYDPGAAGGVRLFQIQIDRSRRRPALITDLHADPGRKAGPLTITWTLAASAEVKVTVTSLTGAVVRQIVVGRASAAGLNSLTWDLRDDMGRPVPNGTYCLHLTAEGPDGDLMQATRTVVRMW